MKKINYALLVEPYEEYPVLYTIAQDGTRNIKPTRILGKDMTEKQIKFYIQTEVIPNP